MHESHGVTQRKYIRKAPPQPGKQQPQKKVIPLNGNVGHVTGSESAKAFLSLSEAAQSAGGECASPCRRRVVAIECIADRIEDLRACSCFQGLSITDAVSGNRSTAVAIFTARFRGRPSKFCVVDKDEERNKALGCRL